MAIEKEYLVPTPWGWALKGVVEHNKGGTAAVVAKIRESAVGRPAGSRNAYRKLFDFPHPPTGGDDLVRAVLLLLAVGEDPSDPKWGLDVTQIPPFYGTVRRLRDLLKRAPDQHRRNLGWSFVIAAAA